MPSVTRMTQPVSLGERSSFLKEYNIYIEEKIHTKNVYLGLCTNQHTVRLNHYEVKKIPDRLRHIKSIGLIIDWLNMSVLSFLSSVWLGTSTSDEVLKRALLQNADK